MLVPDPSSWKLEHLNQYAVYIPGTQQQPLVINGNQTARNVQRQTNWMAVRKQMFSGSDAAEEKACTCYKCVKERAVKKEKSQTCTCDKCVKEFLLKEAKKGNVMSGNGENPLN
jgi:hypothetical protein